jgi:hypothetical protein
MLRYKSNFSTQCRLCVFTVLLALCVQLGATSHALIKMDDKSIKLALTYGMKNQRMGYKSLLGPNWLESTDGTLLNIYTPFMMLAAKSSRGGFSPEPTEKDVEDAKKKYARLIQHMKDPKETLDVKFSVALYGEEPDFAGRCKVKLMGFGRGKEVKLLPSREILQRTATRMEGVSENPYEAINAYYFKMNDIEPLDEYQFILTRANGTSVTFTVKNSLIY